MEREIKFRGREPSHKGRNYKHGLFGSKLHYLRLDLIKRCYHSKAHKFKWYGARGISVCDEWLASPISFYNWALSNGYKDGLEIDRIDVNGNYSPQNCQFITHKENCAIGKRRLRVTNKSGERNIIKTTHNTFETYGHKDGKQKFLGTFKTINEAIKTRNDYEQINKIQSVL